VMGEYDQKGRLWKVFEYHMNYFYPAGRVAKCECLDFQSMHGSHYGPPSFDKFIPNDPRITEDEYTLESIKKGAR
jgi:hypothetical protein